MFEVGDLVECVDDKVGDRSLNHGQVYIVCEVRNSIYNGQEYLGVHVHGVRTDLDTPFYASRFERAYRYILEIYFPHGTNGTKTRTSVKASSDTRAIVKAFKELSRLRGFVSWCLFPNHDPTTIIASWKCDV